MSDRFHHGRNDFLRFGFRSRLQEGKKKKNSKNIFWAIAKLRRRKKITFLVGVGSKGPFAGDAFAYNKQFLAFFFFWRILGKFFLLLLREEMVWL